ncbi:uncharacterized protein BT62DRAFT_143305 [Guyanagaster necrorhizus]|uniref:Uncharacterized protein n=1 Tax=Guyanagaster necrorhizus TaxID=856835 RepID=A0A9P8AS12_9AGAR|nr:uncharacterized protein BT62DRAFT_143305 [Guyanagaster necrorhizus MCA 3950]KAG7445938.1 hypothetical protein BT62DRAFT_143305 [Guyanagaster necrorhizus MCA 3950]
MIPSPPSLLSSDNTVFAPLSSTPVMDSNSAWSEEDVHSSNLTSGEFDWDITRTWLTDDDINLLNYAIDESLVPRNLFQEFESALDALSSMPPFDPQVIEPSSSLSENKVPELRQTCNLETDDENIINTDLVLPSCTGNRIGHRGGAAQMSGPQSYFYSNQLPHDDSSASLVEHPSAHCVAWINNSDERRPSLDSKAAHFDNRGDISLCYDPARFQTGMKNPHPYSSYSFHGTNQTTFYDIHGYPPSLPHYAVPNPVGSSASFFRDQRFLHPISVRYHPYDSGRASQQASHTLGDIETKPEHPLSSSSSSRSDDDAYASAASSSVSPSSEYSVDNDQLIQPCPAGFHRAEFDPRHQEDLAEKLNLPINKVFYYENFQDETIHKCPLGCGTEFPGYTIREHIKNFHKGMYNGPQVQCDRSLLPEESDIKCSGEKMSAQSFAHHFEDVHCRRSALCVYCLVLQTRRCNLPRHFRRCSALHPERNTRRVQPVIRRSTPKTSSKKRR